MPYFHYVIWGLCLSALSLVSLCYGAVDIPIEHLLTIVIPGYEIHSDVEISKYVVLEIRLPRLITAFVVGFGLAATGVCTQALFKNPLAEPALIGVSNGAAVGAVLVIVFSAWIVDIVPIIVALPVAAFLFGALATLIVLAISTRQKKTDTALLLLSGVAINAVAGACIGLLTFIADDNQLRDLTFWSMGSVAKTGWPELAVTVPIIVVSSLLLLKYRAVLNCLLMGELVAEQIGYDIKRIKLRLIILCTVIVGAAVSISGVIFFIGLVVPHLVRMCYGPNHQSLLPVSMLLGAGLLIVADNIARAVIAPAELPIGLLMSVIGGPFFIFLLLQQRKKMVAM